MEKNIVSDTETERESENNKKRESDGEKQPIETERE